MFPRYKRENQRYRLKPPKEKMTFEKRIRLQLAVTLMLVISGVGVSFMNLPLKKRISHVLYTTYKTETIINSLKPALKTIEKGGKKIALVYREETSDSSVQAKEESHSSAFETTMPENAPMSEWVIPVNGEVSSGFGVRMHPVHGTESMHNGIDIAAPCGERVCAAFSGVVTDVGSDSSNGNYIRIKHKDNTESFYGHLSEIDVSAGDKVSSGDKIGTVGSTGLSTGPHLHFEVLKDGVPLNPLELLKDDVFEEN